MGINQNRSQYISFHMYQNSIIFICIQLSEIFMSKLTLGYWGVRGRGQSLRHLLSYVGLDFDQKIYTTPDQYKADYMSLGDFPNLPYLIDGDFKMSETYAIARYIVRKAGRQELLGKTPADQAIVENFIYVFQTVFGGILGVCMNKKVEDIKMAHFFKTKAQFNKIQKFLQGKDYVVGYLTIADFFIAEQFHYIKVLYPNQYKALKGMLRIQENIEALAQVKSYYDRPVHILTPFLPPNMTGIPMFWPGTQPKVPPPSSPSASIIKTTSKKQEQPKKQQIPVMEAPKQQKSSSILPNQQQKPMIVFQQPQSKQPTLPEAVDIQLPTLETPIKVVLISGSISANSSINYLLTQLTSFEQYTFTFEWADISNLQMHNEDIDEQGTENVNNLRGQVYGAQAVIIGLSETHNSISAVLNNAYNWLVPVLKEKPVAMVSMQCEQTAFRNILEKEGISYMKNPGLNISPQNFFDESGNLNEQSYYMCKQYLYALAGFINQ